MQLKSLDIIFTLIIVLILFLGCQKEDIVDLESLNISNDTTLINLETDSSSNARSLFIRNHDIKFMHLQSKGMTYDGRQVSIDWNGTFKRGPGFSASNIWYFSKGTLTVTVDGMSTIVFENAPSLTGSSAFRDSYIQGIDRLASGKDYRKYNFFLYDLILSRERVEIDIRGAFSNRTGNDDPFNHYIRVWINDSYTSSSLCYYEGTPRIIRFD